MREIPQQEIIDVLKRIAGGESDVNKFDPDVRAELVRIGLVNCTPERTIELTEQGKQKLKTGD